MSETLEQLLLKRPESMGQLIEEITPEIYTNLKTAVELGKWNDGSRLSTEQIESSMQLVILYESKNLPHQERTGVELVNNCASKQADDSPATNSSNEQTLNFMQEGGSQSQS